MPPPDPRLRFDYRYLAASSLLGVPDVTFNFIPTESESGAPTMPVAESLEVVAARAAWVPPNPTANFNLSETCPACREEGGNFYCEYCFHRTPHVSGANARRRWDAGTCGPAYHAYACPDCRETHVRHTGESVSTTPVYERAGGFASPPLTLSMNGLPVREMGGIPSDHHWMTDCLYRRQTEVSLPLGGRRVAMVATAGYMLIEGKLQLLPGDTPAIARAHIYRPRSGAHVNPRAGYPHEILCNAPYAASADSLYPEADMLHNAAVHWVTQNADEVARQLYGARHPGLPGVDTIAPVRSADLEETNAAPRPRSRSARAAMMEEAARTALGDTITRRSLFYNAGGEVISPSGNVFPGLVRGFPVVVDTTTPRGQVNLVPSPDASYIRALAIPDDNNLTRELLETILPYAQENPSGVALYPHLPTPVVSFLEGEGEQDEEPAF